MPQQHLPSDPETLSLALAHDAYRSGTVRIANANLEGYSHLVATRQGLFAVSQTQISLVAHGLFFGITFCAASIYIFEACDLPRARTSRGRIIRLSLSGQRIVNSEVVLAGLDNGCHQIDLIDGRLCILDTYNQSIIRVHPDGSGMETMRPLPPAASNDWSGGYAHMNALLQVGKSIHILLHKGGVHTGLASEVLICDLAWNPLETYRLPGMGCHNLAALEDGTLLSCGSLAGELISLGGMHLPLSPMMTRGLSAGSDSIAVGASKFSSRRDRHLTHGTVTFLDRQFQLVGELRIPAAPTEIRRIDAQDYSLSSHLQNKKVNSISGHCLHAPCNYNDDPEPGERSREKIG